MKIFIPTCDKYINCIESLKYTVDKYWSTDLDITVLGYSDLNFNYKNWKFISMGVDRGPEFVCNDLNVFFDSIDEKYFIYLNDDILISEKVNIDLLDIFEKIISLNNNVGRICLTSDVDKNGINNEIFESISDYNIVKLSQTALYRLSTQSSIWNREYLLKYLKSGNLWNFELEESKKSNNDGYDIIGSCNKYVINFTHLYKKGLLSNDWYKIVNSFSSLKKEDIKIVKKILKI